MALTSWKGAVVGKQDIFIAKNYLSEDEIDSLNRFVMVFLETAELRAKNREDITMIFWRDNMNKIIALNDKILLDHKGNISNAQMEKMVATLYSKFDAKRKIEDAEAADEQDLKELKALEEMVKSKKK